MSPADKVIGCFMYVADKRPVLAFNTAGEALAFKKGFSGAEIYSNKTHVFLPTPHGLEFVRGGKNGETAYVFHYPEQARHWFQQLNGYGRMYEDGDFPKRSVFMGNEGLGYGGMPVWPSVA